MNINGFEIERRFLIAMPEPEFLQALDGSEIVQTYLLGEKGTTERVRCRRWPDCCVYTHTVKRKVSNVRRYEEEREITEADYEVLLRRADPARRPIRKRRYCLRDATFTWEIDVFPFWQRQAIMEIELNDEAQSFSFPTGVRILREISDDKRYTNAALSKAVPDEDVF
ncbi:MAG: hypothetical protein IJV41_07245 [Oscillospiraceae bacterium]|nr:hypothetical protein [Oscillospiraceae bacterium]